MNLPQSIGDAVKNLFIKEKTLSEHWFARDEKLRFIIMASINMGFRYLLFIMLTLTFKELHYQFTLLLMWFISSFIAFYSYKKLVFATNGNHLKEYLKSIAIWFLSYFINAGLLVLLVSRLSWNIYAAQAIAISVLLISNYLLFKHFAFRQPAPLRWWEKMLSVFDIIK